MYSNLLDSTLKLYRTDLFRNVLFALARSHDDTLECGKRTRLVNDSYEARILNKWRYEPRLRATPRKRVVYLRATTGKRVVYEPRALSSVCSNARSADQSVYSYYRLHTVPLPVQRTAANVIQLDKLNRNHVSAITYQSPMRQNCCSKLYTLLYL